MHTCMNSYIKQAPPLSHRPQTTGKMTFIHSFNPDISIAPLSVHYYSEALPTITVIDSVRVYTMKRYRQPYTVELLNLFWQTTHLTQYKKFRDTPLLILLQLSTF